MGNLAHMLTTFPRTGVNAYGLGQVQNLDITEAQLVPVAVKPMGDERKVVAPHPTISDHACFHLSSYNLTRSNSQGARRAGDLPKSAAASVVM